MSEPTSPALVVHYHEIGLKGRNRQYFEDALVRNLRRSLRGTGYTRVRRGYGRILVDLEANAPVEEAADRCSRVFGVAYVGAGRRVRADLSLIERLAVDMMAEEPFASFAVRARRTHARIEAKSQEINARIGRLIEETLGGPVDLTSPAVTLRIDGHADERGSDEYNLVLSKRRAAEAKRYLVQQGIDGARIDTEGYGEEQPLDPGNNESAWAMNRRAGFQVMSGAVTQR
jgi:tRNA(Ser,Leu) C12 N-acetylase TAN1